MKMPVVFAFTIVALCLVECCVSARQYLFSAAHLKPKAHFREEENIERRKLAADVEPKGYLRELENMKRKMAADVEPKGYLRELENMKRKMGSLSELEEDPGILENIEVAVDPCQGEWTKFEDSCYHVTGAVKTQAEAQEYCNGLHANLVKINSLEENNFVLDVARKHAPNAQQIWLGLEWEEKADPKAFYWFDHSVPTFTNWAPGEPNGYAAEPCAQMFVAGHSNNLAIRSAGYWNDIKCDEKSGLPNGIVCKKLY